MSKGEKPECIRCGKTQEYNPYQNFWYCPDPDCPPGRSRFPFNLAEEMIKLEQENKKKKKRIHKRILYSFGLHRGVETS